MKKTFHLRAELSLSTITYSKGNAFPWAFSSDRTALHRTACSNSNSCKCSAFTPTTPAPQLWQLPNEKDRAPPAPLTQGFTACVCGSTGRCRGPERRAARQTCSVCRCCCTERGEETPPHRSGFHLTTSSGHSSQHQNPSGLKKKKIISNQITITFGSLLVRKMQLEEQ